MMDACALPWFGRQNPGADLCAHASRTRSRTGRFTNAVSPRANGTSLGTSRRKRATRSWWLVIRRGEQLAGGDRIVGCSMMPARHLLALIALVTLALGLVWTGSASAQPSGCYQGCQLPT